MLLENDGCSFFPDQWMGKSLAKCCLEHDEAMATGTTLQEFWGAASDLFTCVRFEVNLGVAIVMFIGVISPVALGLFFFGRKRRKPEPI